MTRKDIELRDHYAGLAMQALIGVHNDAEMSYTIAAEAFYIAKEMMDRRQRTMDSGND
jgi:hypothetical protein